LHLNKRELLPRHFSAQAAEALLNRCKGLLAKRTRLSVARRDKALLSDRRK